MNTEIERLYSEIGAQALALAPDLAGKLLLYAEVEDGVVAPSVFYERGSVHPLVYKEAPDALVDTIYALWETWKNQTGTAEWRAMAYVVRDGKFTIDLTYPDQLDDSDVALSRRPALLLKYFDRREVDYSNP